MITGLSSIFIPTCTARRGTLPLSVDVQNSERLRFATIAVESSSQEKPQCGEKMFRAVGSGSKATSYDHTGQFSSTPICGFSHSTKATRLCCALLSQRDSIQSTKMCIFIQFCLNPNSSKRARHNHAQFTLCLVR